MTSRPELKVDDEGGFISYFNKLPPTDAIRLFERSDYYTVHGSDAHFVAQTVYKTTSVIRQLGSSKNPLPSCTLSVAAFKTFLREVLFTQGKKVEIYASARGSKNAWEVVKTASPGNLQDVEEELVGMVETSPVIVAVKVSVKGESRVVGVAFADASVRELGVGEFVDNDLFSNFESLLIQLGARECIIQDDPSKKDFELAKIRSVVDRCGVSATFKKAGEFTTKDIEQDLSRLLANENAGVLPETQLKLAMGAASALIRYLGLMSDDTNFGQYDLYKHDLAQYMKLDASALKALNLMPGPRDGSKNMSLYGLLNKCKTTFGTRLLAQWLKQPLMDLEEIEKRHLLVEAFVEDTELRQTMQEEHLKSIPDLFRLAKRFQRKLATLEDVVRAYQAVIRIPAFVASLEGVMDEKYKDALDSQYTNKLRDIHDGFHNLQELVETTVDLPALENHEFKIKPEFHEDLKNISAKIEDLKDKMTAEHRRAARDLGLEVDKKLFLEDHRVHGWSFRLTRTEAGAIRNNRDYREISTQKNGVYFTTERLSGLRREFDQQTQSYNSTQSGLVAEVVVVAASYTPALEQLADVVGHLDVIVSFAHVAVHAPSPYVRPKMHARGTGDTILRAARHPCMEVQDDISFITNDVTLLRTTSSFLIITGPNMGGKSTYIRQIGVISLMAQAGCFVPCDSAELTIFDCILARVGASDSQLKGVSTFMAEMLETATILKSATRDSLIIIDELGRGTSTYDGFGLAWAISEFIVKEVGCFALFATHFHELTELGSAWPQVRNLHVVAHVSGEEEGEGGGGGKGKRREVTLLYKVDEGVCDQSFGIHVAELVRFPQKVIAMAKRKADELEDFTAKHDDEASRVSKEEAGEGSLVLKRILVEWKGIVQARESELGEGRRLGREEMRGALRGLVEGKYKEEMGKPFLKSVLAL